MDMIQRQCQNSSMTHFRAQTNEYVPRGRKQRTVSTRSVNAASIHTTHGTRHHMRPLHTLNPYPAQDKRQGGEVELDYGTVVLSTRKNKFLQVASAVRNGCRRCKHRPPPTSAALQESMATRKAGRCRLRLTVIGGALCPSPLDDFVQTAVMVVPCLSQPQTQRHRGGLLGVLCCRPRLAPTALGAAGRYTFVSMFFAADRMMSCTSITTARSTASSASAE